MPPYNVCLLFAVSLCVSVSDSSSPHSVYFDVTKDVVAKAIPPTVYRGFTRDLQLTCSFQQKSGSDFSTLQALIVSKTDSDPKLYRELATITTRTGNDVEQQNSLGAILSGHLSTTNGSHITFKWTYPGIEVKGRYVCEAHGLDDQGHPRISTAKVDINVVEKQIGNEMVLQKMQEIDSRLDVCSDRIGELEASREDMNKRLHKSMTSMMQHQTNLRGHRYFLSRYVSLNSFICESLCQLFGGYLVEINDEEEWLFVTNMTKTVLKDEAGKGILLGATDAGHVGKWTYLRSGDPVTLLHWAPRNPGGGGQHCMHLWNPEDIMGDHHCDTDKTPRFLCEFDFD